MSALQGGCAMLQPKMKLVIGCPANPNLRGKLVRELVEDYRVDACGLAITSPAGFQTDGASIPESLQWIVGKPFENDFRAAAIVHDYLYYTHKARYPNITISREQADACLLDLLAQNGVGWICRHAIYRAVRMAGGGYWNNDNNDKVYLAGLSAQITARGQSPADYGL
jgi:hypothetical protein